MAINPKGPLYLGVNKEAAAPGVVQIKRPLPVGDPRIGQPGAHLIGDEEEAKEKAEAGERPSDARLIIARLNHNASMIQFGTNNPTEMSKEDEFNRRAVEGMDAATRRAEADPKADPERIQRQRELTRRALSGESPALRASIAKKLNYDATVEQEKGIAIPLTPKASRVESVLKKNPAGSYWQDVRQRG